MPDMKCLICKKELPLATESSPRTFAGGNYYGACAAHFPAKHLFPEEWEVKYREFEKLAQAAARKRPASPAQMAMTQTVLEKQGGSVQP